MDADALSFRSFALLLAITACHPASPSTQPTPGRDVIVLISANSEWRALEQVVHATARGSTPWGETLEADGVLYVHGGWGKIDAAASTQYAIDRWQPRLVVNLGTCGGFEGAVKPFDVVLAGRTVVYDIVERMGDPKEAIDAYATTIDLSWLAPPTPVVRGTTRLRRSGSRSGAARRARDHVSRRRRRLGIRRDRARRREEPHARVDPARRQRCRHTDG